MGNHDCALLVDSDSCRGWGWLGKIRGWASRERCERRVLAVLGTVPIAAASALIAVQLFEASALWIALPATFVVLGVGLVAALICAHLR